MTCNKGSSGEPSDCYWVPTDFFDGISFELFSSTAAVVASDSHTYELQTVLALFHKSHRARFVANEWDSHLLVNRLTHANIVYEIDFVGAKSPFTRKQLRETFIVNVELLAFLQRWPMVMKELNHVVEHGEDSALTRFIREQRLGKKLLICDYRATTVVADEGSLKTKWISMLSEYCYRNFALEEMYITIGKMLSGIHYRRKHRMEEVPRNEYERAITNMKQKYDLPVDLAPSSFFKVKKPQNEFTLADENIWAILYPVRYRRFIEGDYFAFAFV